LRLKGERHFRILTHNELDLSFLVPKRPCKDSSNSKQNATTGAMPDRHTQRQTDRQTDASDLIICSALYYSNASGKNYLYLCEQNQ